MSLVHLAADAVRGALLLGGALVVVRLLHGARAAVRRLVLAGALAAALVAPALSAILPNWQLPAPAVRLVATAPIAEPLSEAPASSTTVGSTVVAPDMGQPAPAGLDPSIVLLLVWALGAALTTARLVHGLLRSAALVRRAVPVDAADWGEVIAAAEKDTGGRASVRLSDEVGAPAVTGVLRPVVLLPAEAEQWSDARRRVVLLHELTHVARRDCLVQVIAQLSCAMHWFDPFSWLVARRLRIEREIAADDAVLAAGARASSYAEELMRIAASSRGRDVPLGALGMAQRSELGTRLTSILTPGARAPLSRARRSLIAGSTVAATLLVACASPDTGPPTNVAASAPPPAQARHAESTIMAPLQLIAEEELERLVAEWQPVRATILVLDPATGAIVANAGREAGARADVAAQRALVPGSTFKVVTVAAALEEGAVMRTQRFDCRTRAYGTRSLEALDPSSSGMLDVAEIVAVSSNVGTSRIFDELGAERMGGWLSRFRLGRAPELAGGPAQAGQVPEEVAGGWDGMLVSLGQGVTATPLQMAAIYAAIARGGVYLAPTDVRTDGAARGERVMSTSTAAAVLEMLEGAVQGELATGKAARVEGVRIAGKTGTAEQSVADRAPVTTYASFVGIAPANAPRYVILVGAETARSDARGGTLAAPVFSRVAARALRP